MNNKLKSGLGDSNSEELAGYIAEIQKLCQQLKYEEIAKILYRQVKVTVEQQDKIIAAEK